MSIRSNALAPYSLLTALHTLLKKVFPAMPPFLKGKQSQCIHLSPFLAPISYTGYLLECHTLSPITFFASGITPSTSNLDMWSTIFPALDLLSSPCY